MRNKHGLLSINCTQYGAVEPVVVAALAAGRRQYREDHHMVAGALHNLAVAMSELGLHRHAGELMRRAEGKVRR